MLSGGLAAMALVMLGSDFSYASLRSSYRDKQMKGAACHSKIDGKNLKGAALKGEWKKCMVNLDNYS
jgi:hypothetical protein